MVVSKTTFMVDSMTSTGYEQNWTEVLNYLLTIGFMVIGKLKVSDMMTSYMSEIYIEAGGVLPETLRRGPLLW